MSKKFGGFPDRMRFTPVPNVFFSALLVEIDDPVELKVTMYLFRTLYEKRGFPRLVRLSELYNDRALLMAVRDKSGKTPEQRLVEGLEQAVERGTLLAVGLQVGDGEDRCFFLNTALNRNVVKRVEKGEVSLGEGAVPRAGWIALPEQRPTIFDLYEQNIGLITPLIAEELQQAEEDYPSEWIEDAFREAVGYNRRSWRYIHRILENWATRGRGEDGKGRRHSKASESPGKYLGGKYSHLLQR